MNELDAKIDELRKIENKEILIAEVVILLQNLQKDFNHAMLSKDADILIVESQLADVRESRAECRRALIENNKPTPVEQQHHQQSARLATELGIPLTIKKWCLQDFDIDATPNDLPKLTATYIFFEENNKDET